MSSLAAARADNFYFPTDFDPQKHGSLNKYHGQHALRDRARKLDQGILIIRFEVPFNIWCCQCGEHIGKGVRFNAEKKQVGSYHSTRIWAFTMRHHCGGKITIQTDPKNAEYVVTEGATRKVESYEAEEAQTIELPDEAERAAIRADPLASLERSTLQKRAAESARSQVVQLVEESEAKHKDEYRLNKALRAKLRAAKKEDASLDARRQELGLAEHIKLLPQEPGDAAAAALAFYADDFKYQHNSQHKRRKILTESIFSGGGGGGSSGGGGAVSGPKAGGGRAGHGGEAPARRAASGAAAASEAKAQLLRRAGAAPAPLTRRTLLQKAAQHALQRR